MDRARVALQTVIQYSFCAIFTARTHISNNEINVKFFHFGTERGEQASLRQHVFDFGHFINWKFISALRRPMMGTETAKFTRTKTNESVGFHFISRKINMIWVLRNECARTWTRTTLTWVVFLSLALSHFNSTRIKLTFKTAFGAF